jgi:hypothetical protein
MGPLLCDAAGEREVCADVALQNQYTIGLENTNPNLFLTTFKLRACLPSAATDNNKQFTAQWFCSSCNIETVMGVAQAESMNISFPTMAIHATYTRPGGKLTQQLITYQYYQHPCYQYHGVHFTV